MIVKVHLFVVVVVLKWQIEMGAFRFEDGAKQFRLDVAQNPNDTEESIWCFLCEAQLYGVDEARKRFLEASLSFIFFLVQSTRWQMMMRRKTYSSVMYKLAFDKLKYKLCPGNQLACLIWIAYWYFDCSSILKLTALSINRYSPMNILFTIFYEWGLTRIAIFFNLQPPVCRLVEIQGLSWGKLIICLKTVVIQKRCDWSFRWTTSLVWSRHLVLWFGIYLSDSAPPK